MYSILTTQGTRAVKEEPATVLPNLRRIHHGSTHVALRAIDISLSAVIPAFLAVAWLMVPTILVLVGWHFPINLPGWTRLPGAYEGTSQHAHIASDARLIQYLEVAIFVLAIVLPRGLYRAKRHSFSRAA